MWVRVPPGAREPEPSPSPPYYCPLHRPKLENLQIGSVFDDGITNELQNGSRDENDSKLANSLGDWPTFDSTLLEKLKESDVKPDKLPSPTTRVDNIPFGAFVDDGIKQLVSLSEPYTSKLEDFNKPKEYDENGDQVFKDRAFNAVAHATKKEMDSIEQRLKNIIQTSALSAMAKVK